MKKSYLLMAAAAALMLTACSSENDVLQTTTQKNETTAQQAVGFDVFTPQATNVTRAGDAGVMTTQALKDGEGFGVFAMYTGITDYAATFKPNFMFNEHVSWANGWTYSPLKYWPNETTNDSQTPAPGAVMPDLEKLSFFAYAPYVDLSGGAGSMKTTIAQVGPPAVAEVTEAAYIGSTPETSGIISYTKETRQNDPLVEWGATINLDNNVDLLWGVAPAGMDYTAVNGENVSTTFGMPLTNLVKPDKDKKIKFLFQHALSRMSVSVVSAIDQIAAGDDGGKFDPNQTRVLIEDIKIFGTFSTQGVLNLNNTEANVANWVQTSIVKSNSSSGTPLITLDQGTNNGYLSTDLRYPIDPSTLITDIAGDASKFATLNRGVLPSESVVLSGAVDVNKVLSDVPTFEFGKTYYIQSGNNSVIATAKTANTAKVYSKDASGNYTLVYNSPGGSDPGYVVDGRETNIVMLTGDGSTVAADLTISENDPYWTKDGNVFTKVTSGTTTADTYYKLTENTSFTAAYAGGISYYSAPLPRYFMFAPSKDGEPTNIGVQITYHVITKDTKLDGNISDITNIVTKTIPLTMKSGKSYNLKLILGLTSVKLDATVGEWQVGDGGEVWLPQNVE